MPALSTLTVAGIPGRRRAFAPKSASESGGGRPTLTRRLSRLSAAGIPEPWRARGARSASWDVTIGGPLPRLGSVLSLDSGGSLIFEIRLDYEFEPSQGPQHEAAIGASLPALASTLAGTAQQFSQFTPAGELPKLGGRVMSTFDTSFTADLGGSLGPLGGSVLASIEQFSATPSGALPALTGAIAATHTTLHAGPLLDVLPRLTGSIGGTFVPASFDHQLAGALPRLGGAVTATFDIPTRQAQLVADLPRLAGGFREAAPVVLVTRITLAGRIIDT